MNRMTLASGLLAMAAMPAVFAATQDSTQDSNQDSNHKDINTTAAVAPAKSADTALAALLANDPMLRVSVDNNDAAKAGVPCANLGADWGSCATGRLILVNNGQARITGDGWKLYLHSIRRLLKVDHPDFSVRHLTGDLYELTPRPGALTLGAGERLELPFIAEYWLLRYSGVVPRPYVVVAGVPPAVLKYNDTDDETRYVGPLPGDGARLSGDKTNVPITPITPITPAQKFRQLVERGEPLPARQVARRVALGDAAARLAD